MQLSHEGNDELTDVTRLCLVFQVMEQQFLRHTWLASVLSSIQLGAICVSRVSFFAVQDMMVFSFTNDYELHLTSAILSAAFVLSISAR